MLRTLKKLGKRVPEDVGVFAFGDNEAASCVTPTLSTVRPARKRIGKLTAKAIIDRINGAEPQTRVVEWDLVERESTRRKSV